MKLLIWLVVVLAVVVWVQRAKKNLVQRARDAAAAAAAAARGGENAPDGQRGPAPDRRMAAIERMVQCAQCGIHFPASEAVYGGTGNNSGDADNHVAAAAMVFCCTEHRTLHASQSGTGPA